MRPTRMLTVCAKVVFIIRVGLPIGERCSPENAGPIAAVSALKLQKAGFSEGQVEALDEFAASRVDVSGLATKADFVQLEARVSQIDIKIVQLDAKIAQLDAKCATRVELTETKAEIIKWVVGMGASRRSR